MDLEDRVSLIKMRIEKIRKTYNLYTTSKKPIKLFENKNDHESNSEKLGEKLKVQRA